MTNSVDPDQTAPIVCSGSTLFASILNSSVMLGNYLQQTNATDDFSRRHFQIPFFVDALRVKLFTKIEIQTKPKLARLPPYSNSAVIAWWLQSTSAHKRVPSC